MNRWKFRIGIVLVFALGLVIGGLGTGWWFAHEYHGYRGPRDRVEAHIMKRLSRDLDLTEVQRADLALIVHDVSGKLEEVRVRTEPEIRHILEDGLARSKEKLSREQYERLEKRYQDLRRRWEHRHDED